MKRISGILVIVFAAILVLGWILNAQSRVLYNDSYYVSTWNQMPMMSGMWSGEYWYLGIVTWLAGWGVLIFSSIWVYQKWLAKPTGSRAIELLNARLASGEITIEEYNTIKQELNR